MKVVWTPIAISHLESAYRYIARDSPKSADRVIEDIFTAIERLADYPSMGRSGRVAGTRELIIPTTPFIVAYRIHTHELQLLAVLHTSRKWPGSL